MPFIPAPDPAGLPAPIWLLKFLSVFTLTLHLLAMNLLVGGTALMALAARRAKNDPMASRMFARLARALPVTMSLTITLGVAPLLFVQVIYGQAFYSASVLMAWPWLAIVPLLMVAYYGLYACQFRPDWLARYVTPVAWLSALCILVIGFLFSNSWTLMLAPKVWPALYGSGISGLRLNLGDPSLAPRYLHFLVGGMAAAGLGILFLGRLSRGDDSELADRMADTGRRWFLIATGLQIIIGLWFLFALPDRVRNSFIGGNVVDTTVLTLGIVLALIAMPLVRRRPGAASILTGLAIFLMVGVRHRVRQISLLPEIPVNRLEVMPQWGLLVAFIVVLLAGLATVAWMVMAFVRAKPDASEAAAQVHEA